MVRSEESEDDEYDLEEVAQDRGPHVAQKVENLPLEGRNQLKDANRQNQSSGTAARHTAFRVWVVSASYLSLRESFKG